MFIALGEKLSGNLIDGCVRGGGEGGYSPCQKDYGGLAPLKLSIAVIEQLY